MPSLARRLARRHLLRRVRRAGLVLAGREPATAPTPAQRKALVSSARMAAAAEAKKVTAEQVKAAEARAAKDQKAAGPPPQPLADTFRRGGSFERAVTAEVRHRVAYDHPGRRRASANVGDHVRSLASLGHLVRHQDLEYQGPQDLIGLLARQPKAGCRPSSSSGSRSARSGGGKPWSAEVAPEQDRWFAASARTATSA